MPRITKAMSLSGSETRVLLSAFATLMAMRLALWLLPFSRTQRAAFALGRQPHRGSPDYASPEEICRAITIASRFVPRATCLPQALAARAMLSRRGLVGKLCLGVGKTGTSLNAHAWLENEAGQCLIGHADFSKFARLAPPGDAAEPATAA